MKTQTTGLLLAALLLAGCWQKSLNPFYTATDLIFDAKLAGSWKEYKGENNEGGNIWKFSDADAATKTYKLEIADGDEKQTYDARLFQLDGQRLLDIVSRERGVSTIP